MCAEIMKSDIQISYIARRMPIQIKSLCRKYIVRYVNIDLDVNGAPLARLTFGINSTLTYRYNILVSAELSRNLTAFHRIKASVNTIFRHRNFASQTDRQRAGT